MSFRMIVFQRKNILDYFRLPSSTYSHSKFRWAHNPLGYEIFKLFCRGENFLTHHCEKCRVNCPSGTHAIRAFISENNIACCRRAVPHTPATSNMPSG